MDKRRKRHQLAKQLENEVNTKKVTLKAPATYGLGKPPPLNDKYIIYDIYICTYIHIYLIYDKNWHGKKMRIVKFI